MPKLAIYVPKNKMKEIERWRKRINFSQIFMDALAREIRERSRNVKLDDDKLAAAARHYKRQLAENSEPLVDYGFKLGGDHVADCKLAVPTIERLAAIEDPDMLSEEELELAAAAIGGDLAGVDEFSRGHGYQDSSHPTWRSIVYGGYVRGVAAVWQRVCDKIRSA